MDDPADVAPAQAPEADEPRPSSTPDAPEPPGDSAAGDG
jgi:hypothetical protein